MTEDPKGFLDVRGGLPVMRVFAQLSALRLGGPSKGGMSGLEESRLLVFTPGVLNRLANILRNPAVVAPAPR